MKRLMMLLAAALLAAAPAMAQPAQRPGGHGRMGGPMMGPGGPMAILRGLNLTDDQRQQIKAILDENRPSEPPHTMQLERKLHAAVINGDAGAIEALKTQLLQAHEPEQPGHHARATGEIVSSSQSSVMTLNRLIPEN